jgi:DNA polymerase-3 subunit alpha
MALFGEDSVNFGRYARMGLSIYITGRVQAKRYRQDELEVKIASISLLADVKEKLVSKITLQIPLSELTDNTVAELSALVKNNSGNSLLYFNVVGEETGTSLRLFSRQERVQVDKRFVDHLTNNLQIDFTIN